jgi:hypothetical protein
MKQQNSQNITIMKKNIIISAVITASSIFGAVAQDAKPVNQKVLQAIETTYSGVTNLRIEPFKNVLRCKFQHDGNVWLAFYEKDGHAIARGRLIRSVSQLPILVQNGVLNAKGSLEKKFGLSIIVSMYEMMEDGFLNYYITLDNEKVGAVYSVSPHGSFSLRSRTKKEFVEKQPEEVIAKKN